jgi:hypothetical protein
MASANPNVPENFFAAGYVLAMRSQQRVQDPQLDSLYIAETRIYVLRCAMTSIGVDSLNGKPLSSLYYLYHISETVSGTPVLDLVSDPTNAYWGLQTNGYERTFRAVSCEWFRFETTQVVAGVETAGVIPIVTYNTTQNFDWPPVLDGNIDFLDYARRDGGQDIFVRYNLLRDGYNGPCKVVIGRSWSKEPQICAVPVQMLPTPAQYSCPFFSVNVPSSLHGALTFVCDIGSNDPVYNLNAGSTRTTIATNFTDWPSTLVAVDQQEPFRGGYLRTVVTVYKPA